MREIKFRAWFTKDETDYGGPLVGRMVYFDKPTYCDEYNIFGWDLSEASRSPGEGNYSNLCADVDNFKLMQFTGLKTRGGQEVYEDDILSIDGQVGQVFWDQFSCGFRWGRDIDSNIERTVYLNSFALSFYEVIGNIYENPNLLNVPPGTK